MMKRQIISILAVATLSLSAYAQESMTFAYASKDATVTPVGSMRTDQYDVAIALTNPSIYGMTITSIDIPVLPCQYASDLSAWLSTDLRLEQKGANKVNVPDISIPLDMPTGDGLQWVTAELESPYTIPDGGVYVGYSFKINAIDQAIDASRYPVVATTGVEAGSLWLHTTKTYKSWDDRSAELNAMSMIQVTMIGNVIPANAARLGAIPFKYVAANTPASVSVMVYNVGSEPIKTISYTAKASAESHSRVKELNPPIPATFGYGEPVDFEIPQLTEEGECNVAITIDAVNGESVSGVSARGKVQVALFVPKHNALVEEYTGMWCGNCPRGFVAMEEMSRMYPDFIGIAYHNRDALAMESGDPGITDGYPNSSIDRAVVCDPYFADPASSTFSMPQVWQAYCDIFTPVEVEVNAVWDETSQTVKATSTLNWATVPADAMTANYRMEYVLVADSLSQIYWYQENYYADGAQGYPEYMDEFTHAGKYVFGLVFNDAAMMTSGFRGIKGSIPSINVGEKTSHDYTFDTTTAYTYNGEKYPFDKSHLRVVAFVLKGDGIGTVLNAACTSVQVPEGINDIVADESKKISDIEYYDLSGRRINAPQQGVTIRVTRHADGTASRLKIAR